MLRKFSWIVLVIAVIAGVHFALQGIIQSGDAKMREGPDLEKVARLEAADPVHGAKVRAGMVKYESICRLCHHRTGHRRQVHAAHYRQDRRTDRDFVEVVPQRYP